MKKLFPVLACVALTFNGVAQQAADKALNEAQAVLAKMTLEEKLSLCAGISTMSLNPIPRVGINKEFTFDDSSCNVRAELARMTFDAATKPDDPSDQSTSMPTLETLACTWDRSLASAFGSLIGQELRARNKDMILGPGVNIMRTPLCGRNFEYLTEDPALGAALVVEYIKGVQSHDAAACVKHFAANSQELNRFGVVATIDERTLHEIYLPIFRAAVKDAGVLAVMNAYNQIAVPGVFDAKFCSHNPYLDRDVLRKAWSFKGLVVTDWGSLHDTVAGVLGGTDIEMNAGNDIRLFKPEPLQKAIKEGKITEANIDEMALHTLYVMAKVGFFDGRKREAGCINTKEHQALARRVAEAGIVLLKNDTGVLPLDPKGVKSVVVMGKGAVTKHCNGGASAEGKPPYEVVPLEGITNRLGSAVKVVYLPLPLGDQHSAFADLESEVRRADAVIVLTGTEHGSGRAQECEGGDRPDLLLPVGHDEAIAKVLAWAPKAVIVNHSGAPVEMPWVKQAATLVQYGYAGMEGGNALAAILFGDVNPSGKLPHTCPFKLADTPAAALGNYNETNVVYAEGIFVGYRWYDKKALAPMFPFGHGLSYTTFKYGKISASSKKLAPNGTLTVSVEVSNTGKREGQEIVQLYVRDLAKTPKVEREVRALKNFAKVALKPGESKIVTLAVKPGDLAYFDVKAKNFRADAGEYAVEIGASSRDIKGQVAFTLAGDYTEAD